MGRLSELDGIELSIVLTTPSPKQLSTAKKTPKMLEDNLLAWKKV